MKNKVSFSNIWVGLLFLLPTIVALRNDVLTWGYAFNFGWFGPHFTQISLFIGGFILLSVSLFINNDKMFCAGLIAEIIYNAIRMVDYANRNTFENFAWVVSYLVSIASWGLLLFSVFKKNYAKKLVLLSAVLQTLAPFIWNLDHVLKEQEKISYLFSGMWVAILLCIPIVLSTFVFNNEEFCLNSIRRPIKVKAKPAVNKTNQYDDLRTLKELLDTGVITQEEFEQKKKQILEL